MRKLFPEGIGVKRVAFSCSHPNLSLAHAKTTACFLQECHCFHYNSPPLAFFVFNDIVFTGMF